MTVGVKRVFVCVRVGGERGGETERESQSVSITRWGKCDKCVSMNVCVCVSVCERVSMSVCGCRQTLAGSWPCHSVSHTLSDVV